MPLCQPATERTLETTADNLRNQDSISKDPRSSTVNTTENTFYDMLGMSAAMSDSAAGHTLCVPIEPNMAMMGVRFGCRRLWGDMLPKDTGT